MLGEYASDKPSATASTRKTKNLSTSSIVGTVISSVGLAGVEVVVTT